MTKWPIINRAEKLYSFAYLAAAFVIGGLLGACFSGPPWWAMALLCFVLAWFNPLATVLAESLLRDQQFPQGTREEWLFVIFWPIALVFTRENHE